MPRTLAAGYRRAEEEQIGSLPGGFLQRIGSPHGRHRVRVAHERDEKRDESRIGEGGSGHLIRAAGRVPIPSREPRREGGVALNAEFDCLADETIVFADGSTLEIQGVQLGNAVPSTRTIVGGSGQYLGAAGTVSVAPTEDLTLWTKTIEIVP